MDKKQLIKALKTLNLSESSINEIHAFIEGQINEQLNSEIKNLTAKVFGFLKQTRETIKESVVKELEESDVNYRNSQIFEDLKSLLNLESDSKEAKVDSNLEKENKDLKEELSLLNSSLETVMEENQELKENFKVVARKAKVLIESKKTLEKKVNKLQESSGKPFKSSEKAVAISHSEKDVEASNDDSEKNEFITEETKALAN